MSKDAAGHLLFEGRSNHWRSIGESKWSRLRTGRRIAIVEGSCRRNRGRFCCRDIEQTADAPAVTNRSAQRRVISRKAIFEAWRRFVRMRRRTHELLRREGDAYPPVV